MIKYTINYHKQMNCYIVWKETWNKKSGGVYSLFKGTYKQCLEYRKNMLKTKEV